MGQAVETNEICEQINIQLDALEKKACDELVDGSYERDEDGNYYAVIDGLKFDFPIQQPEKLVQAIKLIYDTINEYIKLGYTDEKLYVTGDELMKNRDIIDIRVDNLPGTTFWDRGMVEHKKMENIFGKNFSLTNKKIFAAQIQEAIRRKGYYDQLQRLTKTH